ncbi:MAG: hypothetical protein E6J87_13735 [Deltaproteobacteria bacterium]|nr:MAG: hypothetical protein E6J87_13735 [Deltaproteobacteria bacterium]
MGKALKELAQGPPSTSEDAAIAALDARLEKFEREMRDAALEVPVTQLRATLPERLTADRCGVLDLLDLILGAEIRRLEGTRERIPTLDYLITLLCTGADPQAPLQDPVTLTHRLHQLCERSTVDYDPRLPELEAEFYASAELPEADLRDEVEQGTLRRRKMELETNYFAPRLLRAIVTYNAALMRRIDEDGLSSQGRGSLPRTDAPAAGVALFERPAPSKLSLFERPALSKLSLSERPALAKLSLFERPALAKLAAALRRRTAGDPPALDPIDRVAWCLELTDLTGAEREALLSESTGHREGLEGTTILFGLLCRSAGVLEAEFPAIGIAPSELSGAWSQELADLLQQEVNRRIASDYSAASALTDLKNKFVTHAGSGRSRVRRAAQPSMPIREDASEPSGKSTTRLTKTALRSRRKEAVTPGWREWPWARIARAGAAGMLTLVALVLVDTIVWGTGRVGRAELERMSPFLVDGKRSDDGAGTAFAGTLDDDWSGLAPAKQAEAADALVRSLRERGVREIMVYDDHHRLRIQALGGQSARVVR